MGMTKQRVYHVGTSGWQYDHWRARFYPEDLPKSRWFEHYTSVFECVELNNSFYRQPKSSGWDKWHNEAPPGFRFAVKANRYITHMKRFKDCEEPLKRFLDGAERLKTFLGPVLFQAHPQFRCQDRNLQRLDGFLRLLPKRIDSVFEFRDESWFGDEGLSLLREHGAGFCVQDMPGLKCPIVATARHAYFRFHGIEKAYQGKYSDTALEAWAETMRSLEGIDEVWAFFNNDEKAYATENARTLQDLLTRRP
jgi:uncharacterized protein YecE (DUF72 family)